MNRYAQIYPYEYVDKLSNLEIPGYTGYPGGVVSLSSYASANTMFGGATKSAEFRGAFEAIVKSTPENAVTTNAGYGRVFSGQGSPRNFIEILTATNIHKDKFKARPAFAKYFQKEDWMQAMLDDACLGIDCVGFVGTYMIDAAVKTGYEQLRPLDYAANFPLVKSLGQIKALSVVMLTNGMHIQIIDEVVEEGSDYIKVDLCQSSQGGPQTNLGVIIKAGGGDFLPVETFRGQLADKGTDEEWHNDNEARKLKGLGARNKETYLRAKLTLHNKLSGYQEGAIFHLGNQDSNPVSGFVYVGTARDGLEVHDV